MPTAYSGEKVNTPTFEVANDALRYTMLEPNVLGGTLVGFFGVKRRVKKVN